MFNLSTKEVVSSIEKTPLVNLNGLVYQEYRNFFGNNFNLDIRNKKNFEKLENQTELNRVKLSNDDIDLKKIKIFFMNTQVTKALEKKFKTNLRFESVDIWMDNKGYKLAPHTDNAGIKLALQIYLSNVNKGTGLYDDKGNSIYTFPFKFNSGYALYNNEHSHHGVEEIVDNGRISLYARYS
tara:strand:- start:229 stop:774 length:546 start_codon:yes stop_codon:yes gene_type:complete